MLEAEKAEKKEFSRVIESLRKQGEVDVENLLYMEEQVADKDMENVGIREEVENLTKEKGTFEAKMAGLEERNRELEGENAALEREIGDLRKQVREMGETMVALGAKGAKEGRLTTDGLGWRKCGAADVDSTSRNIGLPAGASSYIAPRASRGRPSMAELRSVLFQRSGLT